MIINLFLAGVWLVLGGSLIVWNWLHPESSFGRIWGSGVSVGWVGLPLALYNLVRWWNIRSYKVDRKLIEEALERRERKHPRPHQEPDPNFIFTDEVPEIPQGSEGERPAEK